MNLKDVLRTNHARLVAVRGDRLPPWDPQIEERINTARHAGSVREPDDTLTPRAPVDLLAAAYLNTANEDHAVAAREAFDVALAAADTLMDSPGTLSISFKVGNSNASGWLGALPFFLDSPSFDDDLVSRIFDTARTLLNYLSENLGQGNMNWRLAHADSLLLNGLRLDPDPDALRWKTLGVDVLNDAYYRQWMPDGVHVERSPVYHTWPAAMMDSVHEIGQAMPELGIVFQVDQLARMWDYALAVTAPTGDKNGMHDCQAIRTGTCTNFARQRRDAFRRRNGLPIVDPPCCQYYPDAGQAFLRSSWDNDATYLTFDATKWGTDHAHFSRNSIQVHSHGRTLLCDPGYLSHTGGYSNEPIGLYGKATRSHNTLNLNGWNQCCTDPQRTQHRQCDGYDVISSDYEGGYYPGDAGWSYVTPMGHGMWASHHRALIWIHGRAIVVVDSLYRQLLEHPEPEACVPSLEMNWQFSEGGAPLEIDEPGRRVITHYPDANAMMLFPLIPTNTQWSVAEGEPDPPRGWVAGEAFKGEIIAAPQLNLRVPRMQGQWAELVTVILPFAGENRPAVQATAEPTAPDNIGSLQLQWQDGSSDRMWWFYRFELMIGQKVAGFDTDASFVHLANDRDGRPIQGAAMDATYVRPLTTTVRDRKEIFRIA